MKWKRDGAARAARCPRSGAKMEFTHINEKGEARMVDVTEKAVTSRTALARGRIRLTPAIMKAILDQAVPKGDVFGVARVAGILAAKQTDRLIPMCHPLPLTGCEVEFSILEKDLAIEATCLAKVEGKTGIEMEALTAVSVALLSIYDMCKAIDKGMVIEEICLLKKTGGKSGTYERSK